MIDSLIDEYFRWLTSQIQEGVEKDYGPLFRLMFEKEFVWLVPNDDNRVGDGLDLRSDFCQYKGIDSYELRNAMPVSFLEVLIGLSQRLAFAAGGDFKGWTWNLLTNLGLNKMSGPLSRTKTNKVETIMDTCIWRTYSSDGVGGFFPLSWPDEDQTKVEIWYQMAAYIDELHPEHG